MKIRKGFIVVFVILAAVWGIVRYGTYTKERGYSEQRLVDVAYIQLAISDYWATQGKLPDSFYDIRSVDPSFHEPGDPECPNIIKFTGSCDLGYDYSVEGPRKYVIYSSGAGRSFENNL
ncbi:MAG TPA: hypothetical protein VJB98_00630 [Candidatus Paceibacterota bacterium]